MHDDLTDAKTLDHICAVLNRTSSGADAFQAIARLVADTGRPYIDDAEDITAEEEDGDHGLDMATVQAGPVTRYLDHPGHPCTAVPAWPMDAPQTPDEVVAFRRRLLRLQLALMDATCDRLGPSGNRLMYYTAESANGVMLAAHGYLNDRCAIERVDIELTKLRDYAAHITSGQARPANGQH